MPFLVLVGDVCLMRGALLSWHGSLDEMKREQKLGSAYCRHYEGREVGTKLLNCHSCTFFLFIEWVKVFVGDYSLFMLDFFGVVRL